MKNPNEICGIWHGENASAAITEDFSIVFLRLEPELIAAVLNHSEHGTTGTVYGIGKNHDAHAIYRIVNPSSGKICCNDENEEGLKAHGNDKAELDGESGRLIYTAYNGNRFELTLAEKLDSGYFVKDKNDASLSTAEKMAKWNILSCFEYGDDFYSVHIDTLKYSAFFGFNEKDNFLYCRIGQNAYCEKGWAMLSTTCIRMNESRMLKDNLLALKDYIPDESCFVKDGCSFPDDGGWYWSLKEVTNDVIYLNGCGGDTYEIHRD